MNDLLEQLKQRFANAVLETTTTFGDDCAVITVASLLEVAQFLKTDAHMDFLMDVCAVDYPERKERFEVVYHFYALSTRKRLRLKVRVTEANPQVPTLFNLWKAADWFEREAFDLMGIIFVGHPCLRRLLTYEEFVGHPLRKDYPVNHRQMIPTPITLMD